MASTPEQQLDSEDLAATTLSEVPQQNAIETDSNGARTSDSTSHNHLQPRFFGTDDMPDEMRKTAVEAARAAMQKKTNRDRAEHVKKHFDKTYANTTATGKWHCIVGTDFGSYVTHESQSFVFFQLGAYFFLVFKA